MYSYYRKPKYKVHEQDQSGKTYCQIENSGPKVVEKLICSEVFPDGREHCLNCESVKMQRLYENTPGYGLDREFYEIMGRLQ